MEPRDDVVEIDNPSSPALSPPSPPSLSQPAEQSTLPPNSDSRQISQPTPPTPTTSPSTQQPTPSQKAREIQDAALRFLANASNETLSACAVGLCASTYLVLGRVGLVLIGAVGGIVLHATWEQNQNAGDDDKGRTEAARRRKEQGLEIAKRALAWRDRSTAEEDNVLHKLDLSFVTKELDYTGFQTKTKEALTQFTDAVIRDYVKWWYSPILPMEESFPAMSRQVLTRFILSFVNHISRRRTEDPFLDFFAHSTSIIIVFLNELGTALKASPNQDVKAAIRTYLEYEPDSSLANVLNLQQQERKLRLVADDILQHFLDPKTYDCLPAQAFLREVLATLILQATINTCAKPEWINGWIVYLLEEGEPEILNVIDETVEELGDTLASVKARDTASAEGKKHQRRVSRAEEAMQEAMREAQRLNEMIAEDDARRKRGEALPETESIVSSETNDTGIPTPTSSDSDQNGNRTESQEDSMIFDSEGNMLPSRTSSPARVSSPARPKEKGFTSFDQLTSSAIPTALQLESTPPALTEAMSAVPLTLHNASITLLDMGEGIDKIPLKIKPEDEFLVQIEPASSRFPGWMVSRKYPDFEPLHETLRRIAAVSGVPEFNSQHAYVPEWRGQSRSSLIGHLEMYLKDALKHNRLAESGAMKKFLDKDTGLDKIPAGNKNVLLQGAAALDNVGKGFINVLGQGGKGIAGGGKAVLGGVQGVFGAVGSAVGAPKRGTSSTRTSTADLSRSMTGSTTTLNSGRASLDFVGTSEVHDDTRPPLQTRPSYSSSMRTKDSGKDTASPSQEVLNLPPPPSEMSEDFEPVARTSDLSHRPTPSISSRPSRPATPTQSTQSASVLTAKETFPEPAPIAESSGATTTKPKPSKKDSPITEEETRITVDLMFAIITSTYSLSSAWALRLSLLTAAKTYLLRPNNPQLETIRTLLQESVINNNTTDSAIAGHVRKLRENSLPTEDELAKWPKEASAEEKETLRVKARKLLVEKGMPQALTSVMGQAASGEALGKVFDCLQVEEVARGLMFAVMLQGIRAVMQ